MRKIKDILRLRQKAGLSYRATARALNIGYGTVMGYPERSKKAKLQWSLPSDVRDRIHLMGTALRSSSGRVASNAA